MINWYRFQSGRCGGANPSSHVTVFPNPEFQNYFRRFVKLFFKLGFQHFSLET